MSTYGIKAPEQIKGIYDSWKEVEQLVKGTKGAIFKKFDTAMEALDFINDESSSTLAVTDDDYTKEFLSNVSGTTKLVHIHSPFVNKVGQFDPTRPLVIYVDGSINPKTNRLGMGACFLQDGVVFAEQTSGAKQVYGARNAESESYASLAAIKQAIQLGFKEVSIIHDYAGLANVVTGAWKVKSEVSAMYVNEITELKKHITINFVKVEGHTGVKWNERADYLSRLGAGLVK